MENPVVYRVLDSPIVLLSGIATCAKNGSSTHEKEIQKGTKEEIQKGIQQKERWRLEKVPMENGRWSLDGYKFYEAAVFEENRKFGIISFKLLDEEELAQLWVFADNLTEKARSFGVILPQAHDMVTYVDSVDDVERIMSKSVAEYDPCFFLVLVEKMNDNIYTEVKRVGDIRLGVVSQCLELEQVQLSESKTLTKSLMKLNAKFEGVNYLVADSGFDAFLSDKIITLASTFVLGIDVLKLDDPVKSGTPYFAAVKNLHEHGLYVVHSKMFSKFDSQVAGNVEVNHSQYAASINVGKFKTSVKPFVDTLDCIRRLAFEHCTMTRRRMPKNIMIFRTDLKETDDYEQVVNEEVRLLRNSYRQTHTWKAEEPKITIVLVQRKWRRIAACSEESENTILPGTVVEETDDYDDVTDFGFSISSGSSGKRFSLPTHYRVILNENQYPMKEIQRFTYSLCCMSVSSTRSLNVPAPIRYARLAAKRACVHLHNMDVDVDDEKEWPKFTTVSSPLYSSMYFL